MPPARSTISSESLKTDSIEEFRDRIQAIVDKAVAKAVRVVVAEKQAEIDALTFERDAYRERAAELDASLAAATGRQRVYRYATYLGLMGSGASGGWIVGRIEGAGIGLAVGGAVALIVDVVTQLAVR